MVTSNASVLHAVAIGLLSKAVASVPASFEAYKAQFIESFIQLVMTSRSKPTPGLLHAYVALIASFTSLEFSATVLPAIDRAVKRSPEVRFVTHSVCSPAFADLSLLLLLLLYFVSTELATNPCRVGGALWRQSRGRRSYQCSQGHRAHRTVTVLVC